jgi:hypothetical protein
MFLSTSVHEPSITDGSSNSGTGDRLQGAFLLKGGRLIKLSLVSFLDLHLIRLHKYCLALAAMFHVTLYVAIGTSRAWGYKVHQTSQRYKSGIQLEK